MNITNSRLQELLGEYAGYDSAIKLGEVYGTCTMGEFVELLRNAQPSSGMFRDHSCWKCGDGIRPCIAGNPRQCDYPHARND